MIRKTLLIITGAVLVSFSLTGCFSPAIPITGAGYGIIYTGVTAGLDLQPSTRHLKEPYTVIKENVSGQASSDNYFHLVAFGDSSYKAAVEDALSQVPHADDLIDVKVDLRKYSTSLSYTRATLIVTGTAIRYNKKREETPKR